MFKIFHSSSTSSSSSILLARIIARSARRKPRVGIEVKVAHSNLTYSLRSLFLFSLSSPFPAAARAFIMEARHHGAKAELMTDVEERPWKRPRFQQWLRGPRRIPGRVRPGGSASDNKGFISLVVVVVVGLKRVTPRSTQFLPPPSPSWTSFRVSLFHRTNILGRSWEFYFSAKIWTMERAFLKNSSPKRARRNRGWVEGRKKRGTGMRKSSRYPTVA